MRPSRAGFVAGLASCALACSSGSSLGAAVANRDAGTARATIASGAPRRDAAREDATRRDADVDASDTSAPDGGAKDGPAEAGVPTLIALRVTAMSPSDGGGAVALVPPFSATTYDYYVRCSSGPNTLSVSMTASPGAASALTQPAASPVAPMQTLTVTVDENQALVAVATLGASTTSYWVRCLPHDFPALEMTAHLDAGRSPPGYYLVGNLMAKVSAGYAMVLNADGVPVWYRALPAGLGVVDVDDVVGGAVSFIPDSFTSIESFEIAQLALGSTTTVAPTGYATDSHELRVLPNGDYLVLSYPLTAGVDLTGLTIAPTVDGGAPDVLGPNSTIQDCAVVELEPSGAAVWVWLASEHFDPAAVSTLPLTGFGATATLPDGGAVYDVFHCNSIDVDPANGNLLVSAREMDSVFYVERVSGNVLWKMGGVAASKDGATYVSVSDPFFRQHDARLQPGWSTACNGGTGQVSLFDDESEAPGPARGVVYDVVVGAPDGGMGGACDGGSSVDAGAAGRATVAWQYKGQASSAATGSFRIAADGSRVIGWGLGGVPDLAFTEVDVNGNDRLDFRFTDGNATYRAIKVPLNAFDLGVLRSTAGAP